MKNTFFINCVLLVFGLSVFGQTSKADLKQLQKEVGSSIAITDKDAAFPAAKTVKIYLAIKYNKHSGKDFADWAAKWNKTEARQFGTIQIVDKAADANIVAVQFQHGAARVVREESARFKIGKTDPNDSRNDDRFIINSIGNSNARVETSARALELPLYSYLIIRGQDAKWAVDYARIDERLDTGVFPDLLLQSVIEDRLKSR